MFLVIILSSGVSCRGGIIGGIGSIYIFNFQPIRDIKTAKLEITCLYEEIQTEEILNRMSSKKIAKMFRRIAKRDGKKIEFNGKVRILKNPFHS